MSEDIKIGWYWYAEHEGPEDGYMGPFDTRADAIADIKAEGYQGDRCLVFRAKSERVRLSDTFDVDEFLARANEWASDECLSDPETNGLFDLSPAKAESLSRAIVAALDAWEDTNGHRVWSWHVETVGEPEVVVVEVEQ